MQEEEHKRISQELVNLINDFMNKFVLILDPKKYEGHEELFIMTALTPCAMISGTTINKVAVAFLANEDALLHEFLRMVVDGIKVSKEMHSTGETMQ